MDPDALAGRLGLVVPKSFKAEMARRALTPDQLLPWWSPDTDSMIDPLDDPETRADIRHCLNDVWHAPENISNYTAMMEEAIELIRFPNDHDVASFLRRVTA